MIEAILVEDDTPSMLILEKLCGNFSGIRIVDKFSEAKETLSFLEGNAQIDLVFLDINLPDNDGMALASQLKALKQNFQIVFITSDKSYAVDAFDINATDYLVKPISQERFNNAVEKVVKRKSTIQSAPRFIIVRAIEGKVKLNVDEIRFVKSESGWAAIYLTEDRKVNAYITLTDLLELLPKNSFFRPHNSFIVNLDFISKYTKTVIDVEEMEITISRNKRKEFTQFVEAYQTKKSQG